MMRSRKSAKLAKKAATPALLAGGNPQIAKADGDIEGQGWFLGFHCFTRYVKVLPGWGKA